MKPSSRNLIPWDVVVFIAVTAVGLVFSIQNIIHVRDDYRKTEGAEYTMEGRNVGAGLKGGDTLDLGCVIEKELMYGGTVTGAGGICIKGRLCVFRSLASPESEGETFQSIKVRNLTNGDEGTIFFQGNQKHFTTDHLALETGKNVIAVEWRQGKKIHPSSLSIEVFSR